jgi:hypothetical protein
VDVFGQLLRPCLGLHIGTALEPTAAFFQAGVGVRVPSAPSLGGLVETLLVPPVDRDPLGEPVPEPDLAPLPPDRFGDEQWRRVEAVLPAGGDAVRLSGLLKRVRDSDGADGDVPLLVVLRALHAVGSGVSSARSQGDDAVLLAVDDGAVLRDPEFGGADLLVGRAGVA